MSPSPNVVTDLPSADPARPLVSRRLSMLVVATAALFASAPVLAHHGWNWAVDEQSELDGTIEAISMAPPHPSLRVKAADGTSWQIDLGNPRQTERSGFTADSAEVGDSVRVLGNRSKEVDKAHMKAVRITVDGRNYDMYPERIESD